MEEVPAPKPADAGLTGLPDQKQNLELYDAPIENAGGAQKPGEHDGLVDKKCDKCKREFVVGEAEEYKSLCKDCYRMYAQNRKCMSCPGTISPRSPLTVRRCTECFKKKRAETHTTCPTCPKQKAHWLTRRYGAKACDECLLKVRKSKRLSEVSVDDLARGMRTPNNSPTK